MRSAGRGRLLMRGGEPLHYCKQGHQSALYTGATCPFCATLAALAEAQQQIAVLLERLRLAQATEEK